MAWLKSLENGNARDEPKNQMSTYDLGWLWRELGVDAFRCW